MKFLRFFLIASLFFGANSFAHNGDLCSRALALKSGGSKILWTDGPKRPYDVLKYQLILDWRNIFATKTAAFTGVNTITLKLTQSTPSIEFDASYMKIDSIRINGTIITPVPQPVNEKLDIPLPIQFQASGTQLIVTIGYNRNSVKDTGIYFFPKGLLTQHLPKGDTAIVEEDLVYTMSEPTDAHYWMPCNDNPHDKAESEITIIAPNGIETASNGTLVSKESIEPNATSWHWKSDEPIATYLMVADASTFIHWSEAHQSTPAPGDTVHLDFYAWPKDYYQDSITDGSEYNATYFMSRGTSNIMSVLEKHYGHFPFVKYGQVPVQPFLWGGMEHQTLTTINRVWILRDYYTSIAHEMAHQWFGDKTTCESFKDIWLNEGFASFSEAIYYESWGLDPWYMIAIRTKASRYFSDGPIPPRSIYDPPDDDVFNEPMTYYKGACVLHMLRRIVNNDTLFFNSLRDYSNAFAYSTANSMQLRDYLGPRLGHDLFEYFDEWIFGAGHPEYNISWAQNQANTVFLRINQYQTLRDHYTMPVRFLAYHGALVDSLTFENNARSQSFQKSLDYKIDSLRFDNDYLILSTYITAQGDTVNGSVTGQLLRLPEAPALSVKGNNSSQTDFNVYYEDRDIICKFPPQDQNGRIELYNDLGMNLLSISVLPGEGMKRLDMSAFASGAYFLRLATGNVSAVKSISLVR